MYHCRFDQITETATTKRDVVVWHDTSPPYFLQAATEDILIS
jgi:hypothetical protein